MTSKRARTSAAKSCFGALVALPRFHSPRNVGRYSMDRPICLLTAMTDHFSACDPPLKREAKSEGGRRTEPSRRRRKKRWGGREGGSVGKGR